MIELCQLEKGYICCIQYILYAVWQQMKCNLRVSSHTKFCDATTLKALEKLLHFFLILDWHWNLTLDFFLWLLLFLLLLFLQDIFQQTHAMRSTFFNFNVSFNKKKCSQLDYIFFEKYSSETENHVCKIESHVLTFFSYVKLEVRELFEFKLLKWMIWKIKNPWYNRKPLRVDYPKRHFTPFDWHRERNNTNIHKCILYWKPVSKSFFLSSFIELCFYIRLREYLSH